ncbi:MAG: 16S rRNA (cytosine(1402)-N(4))-methyltransferase RsmH [Peptococcaceae bacterium]|jgi:16S rRNA (cytosine1402-N4)-methyltransferase|nr:16S rRNA (cytosine(1402)-N(4))-methyltransferase RsmH [Peptococcaceae bacterium]
MTSERLEQPMFRHRTVLRQEAVDQLFTDPDGVYVDCTLGGAGHSACILERLSAKGRLIGFDQDPQAIENARLLFAADPRFTLIHSNFANLKENLQKRDFFPVDGLLFDLGVSSPQLDEAERGFSYMQDARLDMRMDPGSSLTAAEIVNVWSEEEIARIIWQYGEENWSRRIAQRIVQAREKQPLTGTGELVEVIKAAIPAAARRSGPHPAKRTFQALRIAVNDELGVLDRALDQIPDCLDADGRLAIITFHSLEDRLVKGKMREWAGKCLCPPGLPICSCGKKALMNIITRKPILPTAQEVEMNPRSRSAKLRVAAKI